MDVQVCNHPDLLMMLGNGSKKVRPDGMPDFGSVDRCGKLMVTQQVALPSNWFVSHDVHYDRSYACGSVMDTVYCFLPKLDKF